MVAADLDVNLEALDNKRGAAPAALAPAADEELQNAPSWALPVAIAAAAAAVAFVIMRFKN